MAEWTIDITSAAGALPSSGDPADVLDRLLDALEVAERALGPSVSANIEQGTVSAVYQVDAGDGPSAGILGIRLFLEAQRGAGLAPSYGDQHVELAGEARA